MAIVHYEIWNCPNIEVGLTIPEHVRKLVASGSVTLTDTISSPIRVPAMENMGQPVAFFRVAGGGAERAYAIFAGRDGTPTGTGAHSRSDELPRVLLSEADGFQRVPLPQEGAFAFVRAAAVAS
ncbi:hypothetical protein [Methylorubrum populi]|uniref:hypothetical protein n=1 Tax=Methylorubrum populi TaxID=223967 RepID=UPI003F657FFA